jgi:hypothetical protein
MKTQTYCNGFKQGQNDAKLLSTLNSITNGLNSSYDEINDKYKKGINPFEKDEFLIGYGDGFDYALLKTQ